MVCVCVRVYLCVRICVRAQCLCAAVMRLGLNRHYWRPLRLGLEVISLGSGWKEARRARLML